MNHQLNLKRQLRCIYLSDFFSGLRITDAVWVALLAARGFSLLEIGLAKSIYYTVSLLAEIPSGMAADLFGRKRALVLGGVLVVAYNVLIAFAPNLFVICLAMALNALSNALFSGTSSALTYDSLKQAGREQDYIQVSANEYQITNVTNALGSLTSLLHKFLGFSGFYLLSAAFESISALAITRLEEPIVTETQASRKQHPLRELPAQFAQLIQDSLRVLRSCPSVGRLILSSAVISGSNYLSIMFFQQRLVELGYPTSLLFLPLLLSNLAAMLGTEWGRRIHLHSFRRFYTLCPALRHRMPLRGCRACTGGHFGLYAGRRRIGCLAPAREPTVERCHPQ
jgi:MFS family permease